jgi:hypothetical protein
MPVCGVSYIFNSKAWHSKNPANPLFRGCKKYHAAYYLPTAFNHHPGDIYALPMLHYSQRRAGTSVTR